MKAQDKAEIATALNTRGGQKLLAHLRQHDLQRTAGDPELNLEKLCWLEGRRALARQIIHLSHYEDKNHA